MATQLGLEQGEIESVEADNHTRYRCIAVVMRRWLENADDLPNASRYPKSWPGLISLLEDAELSDVAEELKRALDSLWNIVS